MRRVREYPGRPLVPYHERDRLALYDAHAKRPLAEKKVAEVRIDGDEEATAEAWSVLSLFSLESLSRPAPLTQLLVERVVADELSRADSPAVSALRRGVKDRFGEQVSGQAVLNALRQAMGQVVAHPDADVPSPSKPQRQRSPTAVKSGLTLLVDAGLLPPDAVLDCTLYGITHTARVCDGQIELNGKLYATPSAAAAVLRDGKATNGWTTWRHRGEPLAAFRSKLLQQTPALAGDTEL